MNMPASPVTLQCVGTGDAFGSGGRLNSCYHLSTSDGSLLIDCGCSSLIALQRCGLKAEDISTVVVSHLHGDHFGGIPYLLLEGKYSSRRQRPLTLIGPKGLQIQVEAALDALYPGVCDDGFEFPVHYITLTPRELISYDHFSLQAWPVQHGRSQNVYGLRIEAGGKIISYTGDTEWTEQLIPLAEDSDLLIAECFAYDNPVPSHLDYQTLLKQRQRLGCRRLVLTHMGPEVLDHLDILDIESVNDGDIIVV